ncbi:hypothetical protein BC831DRAFT_490972 [Entophlyctis helioformis]|nr:hypothetical protein BC831DRAFT_490972 [Entophlyctis helioformis]
MLAADSHTRSDTRSGTRSDTGLAPPTAYRPALLLAVQAALLSPSTAASTLHTVRLLGLVAAWHLHSPASASAAGASASAAGSTSGVAATLLLGSSASVCLPLPVCPCLSVLACLPLLTPAARRRNCCHRCARASARPPCPQPHHRSQQRPQQRSDTVPRRALLAAVCPRRIVRPSAGLSAARPCLGPQVGRWSLVDRRIRHLTVPSVPQHSRRVRLGPRVPLCAAGHSPPAPKGFRSLPLCHARLCSPTRSTRL